MVLSPEFTEAFPRSGEILAGGLEEPICCLGFVAVLRLYAIIVPIHARELELSFNVTLLGGFMIPIYRVTDPIVSGFYSWPASELILSFNVTLFGSLPEPRRGIMVV